MSKVSSLLVAASVFLAVVSTGATAHGSEVRSPGDSFKDCDACPDMVVVPAGSFMMGSTKDERDWAASLGGKPGWYEGEKPTHLVRIAQPFAAGKFEVTRAEFSTFVRDTDYTDDRDCRVWDTDAKIWRKDKFWDWRDPGFKQSDREPVVCVDWKAAKAYVSWLAKKTGESYRLLSEAEWEYAARAGTETMRYWGDDRGNDKGCRYANVADQTRAAAPNLSKTKDKVFMCRDGSVFTSDVGRYRANGFGLHDVIGNVWEWTEDCWHGSYAGAPSNGSARVTGGTCSGRVVRGGSWNVGPWYLRAAGRSWSQAGYRSNYVGFAWV